MISTELQHVQAHLNEILTNWQQWNSSYAAMETYLNEAFDRFEGMYYCQIYIIYQLMGLMKYGIKKSLQVIYFHLVPTALWAYIFCLYYINLIQYIQKIDLQTLSSFFP